MPAISSTRPISPCTAKATPTAQSGLGNGYHGAFDFPINVSHPIDKRWTFYSEVFTSRSFESQDKPAYTLDEALSCALTPNLQLDFGGNFSLNSDAFLRAAGASLGACYSRNGIRTIT